MRFLITVKQTWEEPNDGPVLIYKQSVEKIDLKALIDVVNRHSSLRPPKLTASKYNVLKTPEDESI